MEFIDGANIKELTRKGSAASPADVRAVVTKLVEAFSLTMHGEIFNCDPHPGNLLVERGTGRLVILDWGQVSKARREGEADASRPLGLWESERGRHVERERAEST